MSSRNIYLSNEDRALAPIISRALFSSERLVNGGEHTREKVLECMNKYLQHSKLTVDYISFASLETALEIEHYVPSEGALLSTAVRIGKTRLIDNVIIGPTTSSNRTDL